MLTGILSHVTRAPVLFHALCHVTNLIAACDIVAGGHSAAKSFGCVYDGTGPP